MKIYHTETQADYDVLMIELEEQGYLWKNGEKPTEVSMRRRWSIYEKGTGITANLERELEYGSIVLQKIKYPDIPIIKYTAKQEGHTTTPRLVNGGDKQMKKEFYIGQPLIVKETGEKVVLYYNDGESIAPYNVLGDSGRNFKEYHDLKPSTEFKFSQIIAGLEQGYFEEGTKFRMSSIYRVITVKQGFYGLYLEELGESVFLTSKNTNSTWKLVEPRKEMTLEEIEAELGYKIKLKDNGGN